MSECIACAEGATRMTVEANFAATKAANEIIDLAMTEALNHKNKAALQFYRRILSWVLQVIPEELRPETAPERTAAMRNEDSRTWGATQIPCRAIDLL